MIKIRLTNEDLPVNRAWRFVVPCAVSCILVGWLFQPVMVNLIREWWDDPNYSHGFLIPLISLYFMWARRERIFKLPTVPSLLGLAVLASGVGLLLLGKVAAEQFTMRISLLVVLAGLVLYFLGREHLKSLAFPILYLIFMIPLPAIVFNSIAFPLQLIASRVATGSLELLNIPVLREGNLITLTTTTLEVAEACSGIRSLITLLALAVTFAYLTQKDSWRQIVLALSAIPIAIAANAGRVAGTGILAHLYGDRVAQGFFHYYSGWIIFLLAAGLLGTEGLLLSTTLPRGEEPSEGKIIQAHPEVEQPARFRELREQGQLAWHRLTIAMVVLIVGIVSFLMLSRGEPIPLRRQLDGFPLQVGQWQGSGEALPLSILNVLKLTDYIQRLYTSPQRPAIWLYVGYYESQRQGQIIHSPLQCLPGSGWNILSHHYLTLDLPGSVDPVTINHILVGKGEDRLLVLYWYQERGRIIANEYAAKLYLVADAILRNRTDGALVRLSVPLKGSENVTLQDLLGFTRLILPNLMEFLPA